MNSILRKMSLFVVAIAVSTASIQPSASLAQTSGMGSDGNTRLLWRAVDNSIALWDLNFNLNVFADVDYGPYAGWTPVALTSGWNDYSYVMWRYANGAVGVWLVDPYLNFVKIGVAGPYAGWTAESLSSGTSSSYLQLLWKRTDGAISVWSLDQNLNFITSAAYGPYYGYNPAPVGQAFLRQSQSVRPMNKMPAAAMNSHKAALLSARNAMQHHSVTIHALAKNVRIPDLTLP